MCSRFFPAVNGSPVALALALAPPLFVAAPGLATPKLAGPAIGFVLILLALMSVQPVQSSDFGSFTAMAIGSVLGSAIALVVTSPVDVERGQWSA
jgi:uncharacterized membrane protein YccC